MSDSHRLILRDSRATNAIAWAFAFLATANLAVRLHFGVDLTDEAIYSVMPLRFADGGTPFIAELSPLQGSGALMAPFVWAYKQVFGTEGVVLAMRWAYLALSVSAAAASTLLLRTVVSRASAIVLSFAPMLVLAWGMPSAGYVTISTFSMAICLSLTTLGASYAKDRVGLWLFAGGLAAAMATVAYPTVAVVVALVTVFVVVSVGLREALWFAGGAVTALVPAIVHFARGLHGLPRFLEYLDRNGGEPERAGGQIYAGGIDKLRVIGVQFLTFAEALLRPVVYVGVALTSWLFRAATPFVIALGVALSAVPLLVYGDVIEVPTAVVVSLHLLSIVVYVAVPSSRQKGLGWVLACATLYSAVISFTSTSGFLSAAQGSLTALPVILTILLLPSMQAGAWARMVTAGAIVIALCASLAGAWMVTWGDGPPVHMTQRVDSGPYRGLFTTPQRATEIATLQTDLDRFVTPSSTILAYDEFPGPYLMTEARIPDTTIWYGNGNSKDATRYFIELMERDGQIPDIVVRNKLDRSYRDDHVTDAWVEANYELVVSRPTYDILRRVDGSGPQ